jgi:molecular chaperone Hsp33
MLADTLEDQELLTLDAPVVLHRLYHEEDVRMFDREPVAFRCGCSRERVAEVLRAMGPEESASLLEEQGSIEVDCEFCGAHYHFDHVDVEALFTERPVLPGSRTEH